jgi:CO/xanthine dehydrogenase FAD-binding subunit
MHPFALSRADDPAQCIAAHAEDPQLAFIAGGSDLIGLIKDRAALPERACDRAGFHSPTPSCWWPPHRKIGWRM